MCLDPEHVRACYSPAEATYENVTYYLSIISFVEIDRQNVLSRLEKLREQLDRFLPAVE